MVVVYVWEFGAWTVKRELTGIASVVKLALDISDDKCPSTDQTWMPEVLCLVGGLSWHGVARQPNGGNFSSIVCARSLLETKPANDYRSPLRRQLRDL